MTESSELKPCPFCNADLVKRGDWGLYDHKETGCILDGSTLQYTPEIVEQWNTRHADSAEIDQLRARVAELIDELEECSSHLWANGYNNDARRIDDLIKSRRR